MPTKITVKSVRAPISKQNKAKKVSKAAVKKRAVKKSPVKAAVKKPIVKTKAQKKAPVKKKDKPQKFMFSVEENLSFYLNDGRKLYNLRDLENALQGMNIALFSQHVSEEKNDFAQWIQDVFGYVELANQMKRVKTVKSALQKVKSGIL